MDKARKIIIFSLTRSGCIAYTNELLKSFDKYNPIVYVNEESQSQFFKTYNTIKTYNGYFSFFIKSIQFIFIARSLLKEIKKKTKYPILYLPSFHPWNYILSTLAKPLDIPVILTVHDYFTHPGEKNIIVEKLQKMTMANSQKVVFLSHHERHKAIMDKQISNEKTFVLPHPLYRDVAQNILEYNPRPNLLFLGRIKKYKGIDLLINAVKKLDINTLTIAGHGNIKVNEGKKINLINKRLSDTEMMNLLDSHEILVLPYKEASQSGVLALGLSKQMVMVISDLPGLREQISERSAIWSDANENAIVEKINSFIKSRESFDAIKNQLAIEKDERQKMWNSTFKSLINQLQEL